MVDDGVHGVEPWFTDGTTEGTILLRDIAGDGSSSPADLTVADGVVYFNAFDSTNGWELWRTDGTSTGTHLVLTPAETSRDAVRVRINMPNGLEFGLNNSLSAEVLGATPDGMLPGGTVSFFEDGRLVGTAAVENQASTLRFRDPLPGQRVYTATYNGDANFLDAPAWNRTTWNVQKGHLSSISASRIEGTSNVLITFKGVRGYPPTGAIWVLEDGVIQRYAPGSIQPVSDDTSTIVAIDISPAAKTLKIGYSGNSTHYKPRNETIPIPGKRKRPVRP